MPKKIDNSCLLADMHGKEVKPGLKEKRDYVLVNEITWCILKELYDAAPMIKYRDDKDQKSSFNVIPSL
jgi:hypothetical protein